MSSQLDVVECWIADHMDVVKEWDQKKIHWWSLISAGIQLDYRTMKIFIQGLLSCSKKKNHCTESEIHLRQRQVLWKSNDTKVKGEQEM